MKTKDWDDIVGSDQNCTIIVYGRQHDYMCTYCNNMHCGNIYNADDNGGVTKVQSLSQFVHLSTTEEEGAGKIGF